MRQGAAAATRSGGARPPGPAGARAGAVGGPLPRSAGELFSHLVPSVSSAAAAHQGCKGFAEETHYLAALNPHR